MNYQYIEQLLERYWECQTTLEEEAILRAFFAQADVPARLLPYRDLFLAQTAMQGEGLGNDFDQRVLEAIARPQAKLTVTARRTTSLAAARFRPLYRAAASVAIVLTIGMAAHQGVQHVQQTPVASPTLAATADSVDLFVDQPELLPQTEAALTVTPSDTLGPINQ